MLKAISFAAHVTSETCPLIESVALSDETATTETVPEQLIQAHALSSKDWRKAQQDDPTLEFIMQHLKTGSRKPAPQALANTTYDARYFKDWDKLFFCAMTSFIEEL